MKNFLDKIQELNDQKITVTPFTGKSLKATPITFKQQKELIGTVADGAVGGIRLQRIINDIILENIESKDHELTIIDKLPVIFELRIKSIGPNLKTSSENVVDLVPILERIKELKHTQSKSLKHGGLEVELYIPSLKEENKVINATVDVVKKVADTEMGKNIGNIYTYEICKYISTIKFGDSVIIFKDIPVKDRYKIVENLPLTINKDIILFIQNIRNLESDVLTYQEDGETKSFDIDVSFFDS